MVVRRESVELSLRDVDFTTGMAKSAGMTALLNRELDKLDGASVRANVSTGRLADDGIRRTGDSARRSSSDLNQYTGRLGVIATTAATLGPALLPISASAIPAIAGLTGGLGAAAGAIGTAMLAFHGLGDTLKALNAYELNPTTANLQKLRHEMDTLSPQAQQLVYRLDAMEPALRRLQATASNAMFPGLNAGLDHLAAEGPKVTAIVRTIAAEMGRLGAQGGGHIANDADIQRFIAFIRTTAAPTLDAFAKAAGNFLAGFGNMMVAFRPLSADFEQRLLGSSRSFREWTANLGDNPSFQHFVNFVQENGPKVREFFDALGDALIGLAKAAGPWGAAILPLLTDVANVFASIADSPIGPIIYDAAAAFLVFSKVIDPLGTKIMGLGTSMKASAGSMRTGAQGIQADMETTAAASERMRSRIGAAMKGAAGLTGVALLADSTKRAGTDMGDFEAILGGAASGAVWGPWGAAVGGAVGLMTSFAGAQQQAKASVDDLSASLDKQTGAATTQTADLIFQSLGSTVDHLKDAGVTVQEITAAAVQGGPAVDALIARWNKWAEALPTDQQYENQRALSDAMRVSLGQQNTTLAGAISKFKDLRSAEQGLHAVTQSTTAKQAALTLAFNKQKDASHNAADSLFMVSSAVREAGGRAGAANASIGGLIHTMESQAKSITNFGNNMALAARRGIDHGLLLSIQQMGAEGAPIMEKLAHATPKQAAEIKRAVEDVAKANVNMHKRIDELKPPVISVDNHKALAGISDVAKGIALLDGKTATVHIAQVTTGAQARAAGGFITGPGTATSDSIDARLSNGEYVIQAAAVQKYGVSFFDRANAMGFAGGGYASTKGFAVGGPVTAAARVQLEKQVTLGLEAPQALGRLTKAAYAAEKAFDQGLISSSKRLVKAQEQHVSAVQKDYEASKQHTDQLRADMATLRQAIASQFTGNNPFSGSLSFSDPEAQAAFDKLPADVQSKIQGQFAVSSLNSQAATATATTAAIQRLAGELKGSKLSAGQQNDALLYLEQNASLAQIQAYGNDPSQAIAYATAYTNRQSAANAAGTYTANAQYGTQLAVAQVTQRAQLEQLRTATHELVAARRSQQASEKRLAELIKLTSVAPQQTGTAVAKAINGAASAGHKAGVTF